MARSTILVGTILAAATLNPAAHAQFTTLVTDFEGSYGPVDNGRYSAELVFRDPGFSGSTSQFLDALPGVNDNTYLSPADGFSLVHSGTQASSSYWGWLNPSAHAAWMRIVTLNTQFFPNPSLHLGGEVTMWIGGTAWTSGFGAQINGAKVWVGIGVRETGESVPLGANGGVNGAIEWVGLSDKLLEILAGVDGLCDSAVNAATDDIQVNPVGANVGADGVCIDAGTNGVLNSTRLDDDVIASTPVGLYAVPLDGVMRAYVFDFPALQGSGNVFAFTGDGLLAATPSNRGTLDHLMVTNDSGNGPLGAQVMVISVDDVTFEAPVLSPLRVVSSPPPRPLDGVVNVDLIDPAASLVAVYQLTDSGPPTLLGSINPAGSTTAAVPTTPLPAGIDVVARQTVNAVVSEDSARVPVLPAGNGPLRIAISIRETDQYDHLLNCGSNGTGFDANQPSPIEFVGAESTSGFGNPNGERFSTNPDWFEVSLDPCVDGVTAFSGDGVIFVNTNAFGEPLDTKSVWESIFFRIDALNPTPGPYTVYIDDMVLKNADGPGQDCIIDDFEGYTPGDHIVAGNNGTCDTTANTTPPADDVQVVSVGGATTPGQILVSPGPNGVLETTGAGDDAFSSMRARFQTPSAAGGSDGLATTPDQTSVTTEQAFSGTKSLRVRWAFSSASNLNSRLRLTTNEPLTAQSVSILPETFKKPDSVVPVTYAACDDGVDIQFSFMLRLAPAEVPGDCDFDGDVDLGDVACMQSCFDRTPVSAACEGYDLEPTDGDGDVDLPDYKDKFRYLIIGPQS